MRTLRPWNARRTRNTAASSERSSSSDARRTARASSRVGGTPASTRSASASQDCVAIIRAKLARTRPLVKGFDLLEDGAVLRRGEGQLVPAAALGLVHLA